MQKIMAALVKSRHLVVRKDATQLDLAQIHIFWLDTGVDNFHTRT